MLLRDCEHGLFSHHVLRAPAHCRQRCRSWDHLHPQTIAQIVDGHHGAEVWYDQEGCITLFFGPECNVLVAEQESALSEVFVPSVVVLHVPTRVDHRYPDLQCPFGLSELHFHDPTPFADPNVLCCCVHVRLVWRYYTTCLWKSNAPRWGEGRVHC